MRESEGGRRAVRRAVRRPSTPGGAPAEPGSSTRERPAPASASERFRTLDRYRVDREWKRYEGTPQRDLFRELRARFLERHRPSEGWAVDIGSGPGRFASVLGGRPSHRVLLDLSLEMMRSARERQIEAPDGAIVVRGDGGNPPFREGQFAQVVALGNPLGFAAERSDQLLDQLLRLVAPRGTLVLEIVCGPGERSRYLARLPPGAVRRLLAAPVNLVRTRAEREGFRRESRERRPTSEFRRFSPSEILPRLEAGGFEPNEVLSVAPALGADPERVAAIRPDPLAWVHLLEVEELIGRVPARRAAAAALLIAARRT
ncbi:MAG: class I SAM-dependent methyltransferase [Thermoplasmata archaeon]|nr:class I SAM-dependent methyltransferase [Thermoplasmata archaeon]